MALFIVGCAGTPKIKTVEKIVTQKVIEKKLPLGIKAPAPLDGSVIDLPTILDLSLGADYQVNDSWSVFGEVNNVVGGNYERYYNYPVRGIAAKLGVVFRF